VVPDHQAVLLMKALVLWVIQVLDDRVWAGWVDCLLVNHQCLICSMYCCLRGFDMLSFCFVLVALERWNFVVTVYVLVTDCR
jgi:hypothetical protein